MLKFSLLCQNMTSFGNGVRIHWSRVGPYPNMTTALRRRGKSGLRPRRRTSMWGCGQRLELCCHKPTDTRATRAGRGKFGSCPKALERARLCRHLDFRLLLSRTAVLLSYSLGGVLLWQPPGKDYTHFQEFRNLPASEFGTHFPRHHFAQPVDSKLHCFFWLWIMCYLSSL